MMHGLHELTDSDGFAALKPFDTGFYLVLLGLLEVQLIPHG
jgi:hypothetical protein